MSSSKHWALYATNHRLGTHREHRLAGARIGRVGVSLTWTVFHGWKATISAGRSSVEFTIAPGQNDARVGEFLRETFPKAALSRGIEDSKRGRRWRHREDGLGAPSSSWQPDDPVQPEGWEHDGTTWVRKVDGWFRDPYGYWRYTEPGKIGWRQTPDLGWEYIDEPAA